VYAHSLKLQRSYHAVLLVLLQGGRGGGGAAMGGSSAGRRRFPAPRPQRYDKEKFLQANFRFLVSSEWHAYCYVLVCKGLPVHVKDVLLPLQDIAVMFLAPASPQQQG
jgi:hypothetical protein